MGEELVMEPGDSHIGRRIREIRAWRGDHMTLTATAHLAGLTPSYLSRIERGLVPVERRRTVEAIAAALRVAPSELTDQPIAPASPRDVAGHDAVEAVRAVLRDIELDMPPAIVEHGLTEPGPEELTAAVEHAAAVREACDYRTLGELVPTLVAQTHLASRRSAAARELAVRSLMLAFRLAKDLGYPDVGWQAAQQLHRHVEALGHDAWRGVDTFVRAEALTGSGARDRALALVTAGAEDLHLADGRTAQAYGLLHLSAALQSAVTGATGEVDEHLDEAAQVAERTGECNFAQQHFGPRNVAVWRVALAVETGEIGRVPELARAVDVEAIPSAGRQASFYCDLGRGLAARRGREVPAIEALSRAEALAPETTHANAYVRDAVTNLLQRARRDAGGRELRYLAYRMGVAG